MRPDPRAGLLLILLLGACGPSASPSLDPEQLQHEIFLTEPALDQALHLVGELKGPALGLGPEIDFEAWIRSDRWMRVDLRFEDEDGSAAHEVLVWGPDTCLLFDRRKGRYTELGDFPGELELEHGSFRIQHALWLALGRWVADEPLPGRWEGGEWRARDAGVGLRAGFQGLNLKWMELVWRGDRMRATSQERQESAWGTIPRRLELSGSVLESVVRAEWRADSIPPFGDEILDPLLDP